MTANTLNTLRTRCEEALNAVSSTPVQVLCEEAENLNEGETPSIVVNGSTYLTPDADGKGWTVNFDDPYSEHVRVVDSFESAVVQVALAMTQATVVECLTGIAAE